MNSLELCTAIFYLLSLAIITRGQDPTYLYHICANTTVFRGNSTYQANLNLLLASLASNATRNNINGFYNTTSGREDPNDVVYGLFLCRGDFSNNVCRNCVSFATKDIVQRCPTEKVAVVWYDECLLRYSNSSIFSRMDESPPAYMWNTQNVTENLDRFNQLVAFAMNDTATRASSAPSGAKKFAVEQVNFTAFQSVYTLVQCTPDLSSFDCDLGLGVAIGILPACCNRKLGGRVLLPSCNIRYESYQFYNSTAVAAEAPPPPLPPVPRASPPPRPRPPPPEEKGAVITVLIVAIVVPPIAVSIVLFCLMGFCFLSRRARRNNLTSVQENDAGDEITTSESLQFNLVSIKAATNNFSVDNKLGEGGFGEVYKGTLPNGQEIAAKRLSRSSGQGASEFKNEAFLVAKLQHRNLVRLLGFCLEGEEKILVYEFVPNKSLDYFLFNSERQGLLDWSVRHKIIVGIGRGVLYLHEDSRLKIIHRDLKASNILLDGDMNPKISHFGLARIFGVDQSQGSTSRVVGTYGYMAPEYALRGQFSVKSDVYSFGVLILEIISGKKNNSFNQTDGASDLVSYAWKHWTNATPMELMDPTLIDMHSRNEVIRCIQIGLLCVQEDPVSRPAMATIALMLDSYSVTLPLPQKPAIFLQSITKEGIPNKEML